MSLVLLGTVKEPRRREELEVKGRIDDDDDDDENNEDKVDNKADGSASVDTCLTPLSPVSGGFASEIQTWTCPDRRT